MTKMTLVTSGDLSIVTTDQVTIQNLLMFDSPSGNYDLICFTNFQSNDPLESPTMSMYDVANTGGQVENIIVGDFQPSVGIVIDLESQFTGCRVLHKRIHITAIGNNNVNPTQVAELHYRIYQITES